MQRKKQKKIEVDSLMLLKMIMVKYGLSVSEAIRKYTNMFGLPKGF